MREHAAAALLATALAGCGPAESPSCPGLPDDLPADWGVVPEGFDTASFDAEVVAAMRAGCIPAVSVAVVDAEGVLLEAAWGVTDVETQQPVQVSTAFMVASTSKAVDALALLVAEDEGLLDRDDAVEQHVGFPVDNARLGNGVPIRIVELATHSSGIQDNWDQVLDASYQPGDPTEPLGEFLEAYLVPGGTHFHRRNNFYPWPAGREWFYSNVGAALAAHAIASAADEPFDAYTRSRLFEPLGMRDSGWFLADFEDTGRIARPHRVDSDGASWEVLEHYGFPTWPDGQLRTTARDLGQVLRVALGDGVVDGTRVVSPGAVSALAEPPLENLSDWYIQPFVEQQNLLWFSMSLGDRWIVGHDGDDDGVTSEMFYEPATGIGVALIANVSDGQLDGAAREQTWWLEDRLFAIGEQARQEAP